jgi:hypothetical protein
LRCTRAPCSGLSNQLQRSVTLTAQGEEDYVLEVALQLVGATVPLRRKPRGRYCNMHVHVEGLAACAGFEVLDLCEIGIGPCQILASSE